jgi:hypothetical protein
MYIPIGEDKSGLVTLLKCSKHDKVFGDVEAGCPVCIEKAEEEFAIQEMQREQHRDLGPYSFTRGHSVMLCDRHDYIFLDYESCPSCDAERDSINNNRSYLKTL